MLRCRRRVQARRCERRSSCQLWRHAAPSEISLAFLNANPTLDSTISGHFNTGQVRGHPRAPPFEGDEGAPRLTRSSPAGALRHPLPARRHGQGAQVRILINDHYHLLPVARWGRLQTSSGTSSRRASAGSAPTGGRATGERPTELKAPTARRGRRRRVARRTACSDPFGLFGGAGDARKPREAGRHLGNIERNGWPPRPVQTTIPSDRDPPPLHRPSNAATPTPQRPHGDRSRAQAPALIKAFKTCKAGSLVASSRDELSLLAFSSPLRPTPLPFKLLCHRAEGATPYRHADSRRTARRPTADALLPYKP